MRSTWLSCTLLSALACASNPGDDEVGDAGTGDGDGDGPNESSSVDTVISTDADADADADSSTGDGDGDGDTTTGDGDGDTPDCAALPPARGTIVDLTPADAGSLPQIVADAAPGTTFVFAEGTYDLSGANLLHVTTPGLTFRSASDDRDSVILDAGYALGEIFLVAASDTTIAHLTVQRAFYHPIHVTGGDAANVEDVIIHDVAVIDPGQQGIKINTSPEGYFVDFGRVSCSTIELTDAGRPEVIDCYTGGIDAHAARGWVIRDNHIEGFWCDQGLSEHAIHFWVTGRDTLVERNTIVDCARGVGFGLGEMGNGNTRDYGDDPCPEAGGGYLGHIDGLIRNNMIVAARPELFDSQSGFDSGIALEQACGSVAVHNTIVALEQPFVSIEYRWPNTHATLRNNLTTHAIVERDGAQALLEGNLADQGLEHFVDAGGADLHLVGASTAIDAGVLLEAGVADADFDGEARDGAPDVGADERVR
ncbi:hypothetical protein ACNOYE_34625 [Nannocystaceae bacterium ST9]